MAGLRKASQDRYDTPGQSVKECCHKLAKFCECSPDAPATCPICGKGQAKGQHFPAINCRER